jgi:hypothetical protein
VKHYRKRSERPSCKDVPSDGGAIHGQLVELETLADGTQRGRCSDCDLVFRIGPQGQLSVETSFH